MIRFLATALLLVTCSIAQAQSPPWGEYKPAGAGFRVEFPTEPEIETEEVPTDAGPLHMTTAESAIKGEAAYIVSHGLLPPNLIIDPNVALDNAREGLIGSSKAKLRRERRFTIDGQPARRLLLESPDNSLTVIAILVWTRNHYYSMSVIVPRGEENGEKVDRFLKSFTLVSK